MARKQQTKQPVKAKVTPKAAPKQQEKRGAKPLFEGDPKTLEKVIQYLSIGISNRGACAQAGISETAFYGYLQKAREDNDCPEQIKEFADNVTRAKEQANNKAVIAFRSGMDEQNVQEEIVETFSETRLRKNKDGSETPYTYTKTTKRIVNRKNPPDWRAGKDWLVLRDQENFSTKAAVDVTSKGEQINKPISPEEMAALVAQVRGFEDDAIK